MQGTSAYYFGSSNLFWPGAEELRSWRAGAEELKKKLGELGGIGELGIQSCGLR